MGKHQRNRLFLIPLTDGKYGLFNFELLTLPQTTVVHGAIAYNKFNGSIVEDKKKSDVVNLYHKGMLVPVSEFVERYFDDFIIGLENNQEDEELTIINDLISAMEAMTNLIDNEIPLSVKTKLDKAKAFINSYQHIGE